MVLLACGVSFRFYFLCLLLLDAVWCGTYDTTWVFTGVMFVLFDMMRYVLVWWCMWCELYIVSRYGGVVRFMILYQLGW